MKIPANGEKGVKDEFCTLQFGEFDSDESEQITWDGGTTYSCQVSTKPGVPITLLSTINLGEGVEEFVDYVFDGVLRSTSTPRKGSGKKYSYKIKTDKALAYRFEGSKKKGLKFCPIEAKLRSAGDEKDAKFMAGAPETAVSTIEVQHWRKYPEGSESQASSDQPADVKRTPSYEKFARWTDLEQSIPDDTPHEYAMDFTGDVKFSKPLKDRIAEEKTGFKLFRTFKFHFVSPEEFQKLGGAAPRDMPQEVIPVKDKAKEKTGEKDKKVSKSAKGKDKESGESSKTEPDTPSPEKSSSDVAKPQNTGDKSGADDSTTNENAGESIQPIEINSQSTVHTPDTSEPTTNGAEPVAVVDSPTKEDGNGPEQDGELGHKQDHDDDLTNDHFNILQENSSTILEQSQDPLEEYYKTVDEVLEESNGVLDLPDVEMDSGSAIEEKHTSVLHGDSDMDLDQPILPPEFAKKKPPVAYGTKGGLADQATTDLALEEKTRSSVEDTLIRGRSSTPVQREEIQGRTLERMTPPPSTEKKTVESIPMLGSPTPFNFQSPRRALSPLQNMHHALFEGPGNFTALETAPRRASFAFDNSVPGMEGLLPLDLSTPMDSIESRIANSQRGSALLRGRQAGRGRSASPAPRSFTPNYRSREWHANNGDAVEKIPNRSLFSHFEKLADAVVQLNEDVHGAQTAQAIEDVEPSPPAESEQEKKVREVQKIAQRIILEKIEEAQKHHEVTPETQKEIEHILPRTPTQRVALPTPDTPYPQRTSTPRAATPPTPTPQPRARPSEPQPPVQCPSKKHQEPAPAIELASSKKSQATPAVHPAPSKKPIPAAQSSSKKSLPPLIVQTVSSKKPQAAVQPSRKPQASAPPDQQVTEPVASKKSAASSKKSEASSSKKSHAPNPAVQPANSKKRKADATSINKDTENRPTKQTSTPASREKSILARRLEEAKARVEAAKKASEKLKEEENIILEVQKLEEEARQLEQENALRKSNIERVGGSFK